MKASDDWGEVVELSAEATGPIVFHFRPNKYMRVAPERLREWEEFFAVNVGLRPDVELARAWSGDPKETISGSNDDWDDCDYW
jgi:hypothetical protein